MSIQLKTNGKNNKLYAILTICLVIIASILGRMGYNCAKDDRFHNVNTMLEKLIEEDLEGRYSQSQPESMSYNINSKSSTSDSIIIISSEGRQAIEREKKSMTIQEKLRTFIVLLLPHEAPLLLDSIANRLEKETLRVDLDATYALSAEHPNHPQQNHSWGKVEDKKLAYTDTIEIKTEDAYHLTVIAQHNYTSIIRDISIGYKLILSFLFASLLLFSAWHFGLLVQIKQYYKLKQQKMREEIDLQNRLERLKQKEDLIYFKDQFFFSGEEKELFSSDGRPIKIANQQSEILKHLLSANSNKVEKSELVSLVWCKDQAKGVSENTFKVAIAKVNAVFKHNNIDCKVILRNGLIRLCSVEIEELDDPILDKAL